jgi:hypothetical protein
LRSTSNGTVPGCACARICIAAFRSGRVVAMLIPLGPRYDRFSSLVRSTVGVLVGVSGMASSAGSCGA